MLFEGVNEGSSVVEEEVMLMMINVILVRKILLYILCRNLSLFYKNVMCMYMWRESNLYFNNQYVYSIPYIGDYVQWNIHLYMDPNQLL